MDMHDASDSSAAAAATTNANFGSSRRSVKRVTTFMFSEKEDALVQEYYFQ